jgi:hypothetical protein
MSPQAVLPSKPPKSQAMCCCCGGSGALPSSACAATAASADDPGTDMPDAPCASPAADAGTLLLWMPFAAVWSAAVPSNVATIAKLWRQRGGSGGCGGGSGSHVSVLSCSTCRSDSTSPRAWPPAPCPKHVSHTRQPRVGLAPAFPAQACCSPGSLCKPEASSQATYRQAEGGCAPDTRRWPSSSAAACELRGQGASPPQCAWRQLQAPFPHF